MTTEGPGWVCLTHGFFDMVEANITAHMNANSPCDVLKLFRTVPGAGPVGVGGGIVFPVAGSSGIIYKEIDPIAQTFPIGDTVSLVYDVGLLAQMIMHGVTLPARVTNNLFTLVRLTFNDASTSEIANNTNGAVALSGDALDAQFMVPTTHRKVIRKFEIVVRNLLGVPTLGNFGLASVRAYASPVGNATLPP